MIGMSASIVDDSANIFPTSSVGTIFDNFVRAEIGVKPDNEPANYF